MEIENSKYAIALGNGKIELTDQNGKKISTTFDAICDASTDANENFSNINNNTENNINVACKITDSEGLEITNEDLISSVKNNEVAALDVTFEATHTNRLINAAIYTEESMAEDVVSFMLPYGKPLIKNHNRNNEPLGRIINASYDQSEILEDTGTINATWRVTDKDAIEKFADGRYKTMSIGASCSKIVCNTCGKTILNNGKVKFCGHWRGETYKDSVCSWTMTGLTYREGSVVNDPADPYAQVKNIKVIKAKGAKNSMENQNNSSQENYGVIDNILNNTQTQNTQNIQNAQNNTENSQNNNEINDNQQQQTGNNELTAVKNELETVKSELETVKNELEISKNDSVVKDSEIESLKAQIIVKDAESKKNNSLLSDLAKMNKNLLIKNAILLNPDLKAEDLEKQNATQIAAVINSLETIRRTPGTVDNPSLPVNDSHTVVTNKNNVNDEDETNDNSLKNMKDMEKIVNNFFNKK